MTNQPNNMATTLKSLLPIVLIELLLSAVMVGVFAAIGKFSTKVLLGALVGTAVSIINFVVMVISLLRAEQKETVTKGQLVASGTYSLRMVVLLVLLFFVLKTGLFDPLATLLPLLFFRFAITLSNLLHKKGV